jgi:pyruvate carboxylase
MKASTASVFEHEIPGGQYSNLKPQAYALGLAEKFEDIKLMFADVNMLFGDVVKVTPSSKVVGDMALYLVSNGLTVQDVLEKGDSISFPESVVEFFKGHLGQPVGGFPARPATHHPERRHALHRPPQQPLGAHRPRGGIRGIQTAEVRGAIKYTDYLSYLMYPKVFTDYWAKVREFGDISKIPTKNFFFGMKLREETMIELGEGKNMVCELQSIGPSDEDGRRTLFFRVNGQTRNIKVVDRSLNIIRKEHIKAEKGNPLHLGAPLQGLC